MELLTYAALAAGVAVAGLLAYAATKPSTFAVGRSTRIDAPPERIFPLIANLRSMNTWNPFVAPDPDIRISYSGPDSGKGAAHTWSGNRNVGEGRVEITDDIPPSRVELRLQMVKPMKADNTVTFTLEPSTDGTEVTWAMSGRQPYLGKLMAVFVNCDHMVGAQFDKGLASLKTLAEQTTVRS